MVPEGWDDDPMELEVPSMTLAGLELLVKEIFPGGTIVVARDDGELESANAKFEHLYLPGSSLDSTWGEELGRVVAEVSLGNGAFGLVLHLLKFEGQLEVMVEVGDEDAKDYLDHPTNFTELEQVKGHLMGVHVSLTGQEGVFQDHDLFSPKVFRDKLRDRLGPNGTLVSVAHQLGSDNFTYVWLVKVDHPKGIGVRLYSVPVREDAPDDSEEEDCTSFMALEMVANHIFDAISDELFGDKSFDELMGESDLDDDSGE